MSFECTPHEHCIDTALKQAYDVCSAQGARLTESRKRVLELVWVSHAPIKAYDILKELQKEDSGAKPPTVYRALDFLIDHGLVHKIQRLNAYIGCNHPEGSQPCFFLICKQCDIVSEHHDDAYQELIKEISETHHFMPEAMSFEMEGLCGQCVAS
jgi:Fur family zinc uptake transcriptional regulator